MNHNGGQHGKTFAESEGGSISARFPLPVKKAGCYQLLAKAPWFHSSFGKEMSVGVVVTTPNERCGFVWNQNACNGDWLKLGELCLCPGAAVTLNCISNNWITADAFAVVPVRVGIRSAQDGK